MHTCPMGWLANRTYEEKRRWSQSVEAIRGGWRTLLVGFLVLAGTGVSALLLPIDPVLKGVVAGTLFASALWAPFTAITIATYSATVGSWGESFTSDLFKRERASWPLIDDVPMQGRNIDHVAVSPRAVLAIETKYLGASSPWNRNRARDRFCTKLGEAQDRFVRSYAPQTSS